MTATKPDATPLPERIERACRSYPKASPRGPSRKARIYDDESYRVTIYNLARTEKTETPQSRKKRGFALAFGYHLGEGVDHRYDVWEDPPVEGETLAGAIDDFIESLRDTSKRRRRGNAK